MDLSPLYWQTLFWVVQTVVFVPATIFVAFHAGRIADRRSRRIESSVEGEWKSAFMINQNGEWINQEVVASRKWYKRNLEIWSVGGKEEMGWKGHLTVHNDILVGAWENTTYPSTSGAQSLNPKFLLDRSFAVGATSGASGGLGGVIRVSTWVMAKNEADLEIAKKAVVEAIR